MTVYLEETVSNFHVVSQRIKIKPWSSWGMSLTLLSLRPSKSVWWLMIPIHNIPGTVTESNDRISTERAVILFLPPFCNIVEIQVNTFRWPFFSLILAGEKKSGLKQNTSVGNGYILLSQWSKGSHEPSLNITGHYCQGYWLSSITWC